MWIKTYSLLRDEHGQDVLPALVNAEGPVVIEVRARLHEPGKRATLQLRRLGQQHEPIPLCTGATPVMEGVRDAIYLKISNNCRICDVEQMLTEVLNKCTDVDDPKAPATLTEGRMDKGGVNPENTSSVRPRPPGGSGS